MILEPRCNSLSFFLPADADDGEDDDKDDEVDDNDDDFLLNTSLIKHYPFSGFSLSRWNTRSVLIYCTALIVHSIIYSELNDTWEHNIGMYGTECQRGLWALRILPALM